MMIKKYYSISEAQQILAIPTHKLRYFEKATHKLNIFKIKGRRYYTMEDLEFLKNYFFDKKEHTITEVAKSNQENSDNILFEKQEIIYDNILEKIDNLICKFDELAQGAKSNTN